MKDLFFQITKVDEEKRLVTGQACAEVPDRAGEIFDYATSKPLFEKWSNQIAEDTDGKSYGNIRSMHSNVAAGKVAEPLMFDDANKAINITAKVVDDNEWEKVLEGVHTGFSIGGSYVNKWQDAEDKSLTRYTADPGEISLVDRPCVPTAKFFSVVKADGSVLQKAFKENLEKWPDASGYDDHGRGDSSGSKEKSGSSFKPTSANTSTFNSLDSAKEHQSKQDKPAQVFHDGKGGYFVAQNAKQSGKARAAGYEVALDYNGKPPSSDKAEQVSLWKSFEENEMEQELPVTVDQLTDEMAALLNKGDMNAGDMLAAIKKAMAEKGLDDLKFGKKDYSDDQRKDMAANGEALPDGSYPIKTAQDLHNAVQAYGRASDPEKAKAHIKSRAAALGMTDQLPDDWKDGGESEAEKVAKAAAPSAAEMSSAQPAPADNMKANEPTGENASVAQLEAPKIGAIVSFKFGESDFQGKCTELGEGGSVTVSIEGTGEFTCGSPSFTAAEPGSGVDFAMTGEMTRKALSAGLLTKAAAIALRKGMYSVSSFASILASINYLRGDTEWEAAYEEDGSDMPKKLKDWMAQGCDLLRAMVDEECAELIGDPDGDGSVDAYTLVYLSAPSGDVAKSLALNNAVLAKVAQGGSEVKKFAERVDLAKQLQAKVDRFSADLEKQATEATSLRKQLKAKDEELTKAVAKANALEAERKAPAVMAVSKQADVIDEGSKQEKVEPVKDSFGKVDDAATAFKKAMQSPIRVSF